LVSSGKSPAIAGLFLPCYGMHLVKGPLPSAALSHFAKCAIDAKEPEVIRTL
jgi:hypothetical protein